MNPSSFSLSLSLFPVSLLFFALIIQDFISLLEDSKREKRKKEKKKIKRKEIKAKVSG